MREFYTIRDRKMIQYKYMKKKNYIHSTQLPAHITALAAAAMTTTTLFFSSFFSPHTIVIKPGPARRVDPVAGPVWVY